MASVTWLSVVCVLACIAAAFAVPQNGHQHIAEHCSESLLQPQLLATHATTALNGHDASDGALGLQLADEQLRLHHNTTAAVELLLWVVRDAAQLAHKDLAIERLLDLLAKPNAACHCEQTQSQPAASGALDDCTPATLFDDMPISDRLPKNRTAELFVTPFWDTQFSDKLIPDMQHWNAAILSAVLSKQLKPTQHRALKHACEHNSSLTGLVSCTGVSGNHTERVDNIHLFDNAGMPEIGELLRAMLRRIKNKVLKTARSSPCANCSSASLAIASASLYIDHNLGFHRPFSQTSSHAQLTAIYAVSSNVYGSSPDEVSFSDPRPAAGASTFPTWFGFGKSTVWPMVPGSMTVFPSYVPHYFRPNSNQSPRIYIKLDLQLSSRASCDGKDTLLVNPNTCIANVPPPLLRNTVGLWWPTPVLRNQFTGADIAKLNSRIAADILKLEQIDKGVHKSNKGGWHSTTDLFERKNTDFNRLRDLLYDAIFRYLEGAAPSPDVSQPAPSGTLLVEVEAAWACVNRLGDYNSPHVHPDSIVSGVYYVRAANTTASLMLIDPRPGTQSNEAFSALTADQASFVSSTPQDGLVVLFPGWLQHFVEPHDGVNPRIAISFNAKVRRDPEHRHQTGLRFRIPKRHRA